MRMLLDAHTFLWFITGSSRLSDYPLSLIEDTNNTKWLSIVSLWEIAIKLKLGKINLDDPFSTLLDDQVRRNGFGLLPIEFAHLVTISELPLHHRDPFDRLIIAQSITEQMPIVSIDMAFDAYGITRLW